MNVRSPFEWLIAFSVLAGGMTWAQEWGGAPVQYPPPEGYSASAPAPASAPVPIPDGAYCPPEMEDVYADLLPQNRTFRKLEVPPLKLPATDVFRGSWMRLEYLHGDIHRDDHRILGTPIVVADPPPAGGPPADVPDVSQQFPVQFYPDPLDVSGNPPPTGLAQVPTTKDVSWNNAQGIRAGFGIPILKSTWVEARYWAFGKQSETLHIPQFPSTTTAGLHGNTNDTFLATTLTTDGVPGSRLILYDAGFHSIYTNRLQAGDVDLVFNWKTPQLGLRLQPILGYRHEEYSERLEFGGSFDNRSGYLTNLGVGLLSTPQTNDINSQVYNVREQMQIGLRSEFAGRFITVGHQEKFALGSNLVKGSVTTSHLREPGTNPNAATPLTDPAYTYANDRRAVIAPTFDLDVYAKVRINSWMNFRVGYTLMWMGNLGVADRSIRFNEVTNATGGTDPNVYSQLRFNDRVVSALTLGGEIVLP